VTELAVRFGQWRSLVGVLSEPAPEAANPAAPTVLFLNAGLLHHVGPHRIHVNLARRLAAQGLRSLRFDLSGIGDSGPRRDTMARQTSMVAETREAMDYLTQATGAERFVLFGLCTGADQSVRVALADERVVGAVLVDGYAYPTRGHFVRYYARRALRLQSWRSMLSGQHPAVARLVKRMRGQQPPPDKRPAPAPASPRPGLYIKPPRAEAERMLASLDARGCGLQFIFTPTTNFSYRGQLEAMFPSLAGSPRVRVDFLKHANHVFTLLASQRAVMDAVEQWLQTGIGEAPGPPTP